MIQPRHWLQQALLTERRDSAGYVFAMCAHCPWPAGPSSEPALGGGLHHLSLVPMPFLPWGRATVIVVGLARCHISHMLKQCKEVHCYPEQEKVSPNEEEEPGTRWEIGTRLPHRGLCQARSTHRTIPKKWRSCAGPASATLAWVSLHGSNIERGRERKCNGNWGLGLGLTWH